MPVHAHPHAFSSLRPQERDGLTLPTRRNLLKAAGGLAGVSLGQLLAGRAGGAVPKEKSLILLWMAGGPSHIDTLDPKPNRPPENRGPFGVTRTRLPSVLVCEHLPKLAAMLDRFAVIRSVDCRGSNHEPNTVMQTGNRDAEARTNPETRHYPAIGALVSKFHGPNHPAAPGYAAFFRSRTHLAFAGRAGKAHEPFPANDAARLPVYDVVGKDTGTLGGGKLFELPAGVDASRLTDRRGLLARFDALRAGADAGGFDADNRRAVELLTGGRVRDALDWQKEPAAVRERYGPHLWCRQALLARRLVEAGCPFVTLDLSYHPASGTWDTHGDNIPPYGGISKGLGPLLPLFDHLVTTLVSDLHERGLGENTLVVAMGEFGRTPQLGTQGSTDGRNHWPYVMSMLLAGGGLRTGQVIGSSDIEGGQPKDRPVTPGDLAATMYRHFGIDPGQFYEDSTGRPYPLLPHGGEAVRELF